MPGAVKRYSLARLLASQPAALRKRPDFAELCAMLRGSERLRNVRLSALAYRLLNEPRLKPRYAENFRSTYRFPRGPFLCLFIALKWEHVAQKERARIEKEGRIAAIMGAGPREALDGLEYLRKAERALNPETPVWKAGPYPKTLKRARELAVLGLDRWLPILASHAAALRKKYRSVRLPPTDAIIACALLGCLGAARAGGLPSKAALRSSYRTLCKTNHPDLGGDAGRFILIKKAYDLLAAD